MRHAVAIEYDDDLLLNLGTTEEAFSREAKLLLAVKLYELGRITAGRAARLCGRTRVEFLLSLQSLGSPVSNLTCEDAAVDVAFGLNG